jgi:hypothetical protein
MIKQLRKLEKEEDLNRLVRHRKKSIPGILIRQSETHKDFFIVLCAGNLEEWHIDNIDDIQ